jgi:uncharacterized membrane protein YagU involved in acid resistance
MLSRTRARTRASLAADVFVGGLAGTVATGVMTVVMDAFIRRGTMRTFPPKRIVAKALAVLRARGLERHLTPLAMGAHFAYGASLGALHGVLSNVVRRERAPGVAEGLLFGLSIWVTNYVGWIPKAGIMPPPTEDKPGQPLGEIAAHGVFGVCTIAVARAIGASFGARVGRPRRDQRAVFRHA